MKLYPVIADLWKMDGGVAFGVVPKSIWNRNNMADENNMIPIVTRCLLVQTEDRLILIDAGMGHKRDEKYYNVRFREPATTLERLLAAHNFSLNDITDVLFTHFHDDHVGGATLRKQDCTVVPAFPNAAFWCSQSQWEWAIHPNKREGASYFKDNLLPLQDSGRLRFLENGSKLFQGICTRIYNGHTMGQVIPFIQYAEHTIVYMGDFIPTAFNIPMPFIPSVDIQPLVSIVEKAAFLEEAVKKNYILLFEHDYFNECCTVKQTEKGINTDRIFTLDSVTNP